MTEPRKDFRGGAHHCATRLAEAVGSGICPLGRETSFQSTRKGHPVFSKRRSSPSSYPSSTLTRYMLLQTAHRLWDLNYVGRTECNEDFRPVVTQCLLGAVCASRSGTAMSSTRGRPVRTRRCPQAGTVQPGCFGQTAGMAPGSCGHLGNNA